MKYFGQYLSRQVSVGFSIKLLKRIKPVVSITPTKTDAIIVVQNSALALKAAKEEQPELVLWSDQSKHNQSHRSSYSLKKNQLESEKTILGKNEEIIDEELWSISDALATVLEKTVLQSHMQITIFTDSQTSISTKCQEIRTERWASKYILIISLSLFSSHGFKRIKILCWKKTKLFVILL